MNNDLYLNTLTNFCNFIVGTSMMTTAQGKGYKGDRKTKDITDAPEAGGYPVVLNLHPRTTICEWCLQDSPCPNTKTYTRTSDAKTWAGKCLECGEKRIVYLGSK
jgi:hypothetical protein